MARVARTRCQGLEFSPDSFELLRGHLFAVGASRQALTLLDTLDRFKVCFDEQSQRTPEGHRLFQEHFTGNNARFSDSSDTEKNNFKAELTFSHPTMNGEFLFCSWHGKTMSSISPGQSVLVSLFMWFTSVRKSPNVSYF